ncbi:MAG: SPFH domain-containing protein [Desulfobacterales bacterium]
MADNNLVFLENLEWFDESGRQMVHRLPHKGSGEIKYGAQLTVRESQAAVFFYKGKAVGAFGPGRHTLKTGNIPILTKIASIPWALTSPLRAEVYFVNLKVFTNLKWGTRDPVAFKDAELGLVRLRAFGVFNLQVVQPVLFINSLVGTQGMFTTEEIEEYLNRVIVSRFNDYMGQNLDSLLSLPATYDELSEGLSRRLAEDFSHFGIRLTHLYTNAITPPPEVQQAIDDRSRMGVFKDMEKLMQMKAAMAMEKAAEGGEAGSGTGMGTSLGLMLPAMFAQYFSAPKTAAAAQPPAEGASCPECGSAVPADSKFCPQCGHQLVVFDQCARCGKNLAPNAKFCPRCGLAAAAAPQKQFCKHCGAENLAESMFCNDCGEKL